MNARSSDFASFRDFYPYDLSEHADRSCRRMHYLGSSLGLVCLALAILNANAWWVLAGLIAGYGCAWIGHYRFEKNRPATFKYPFYSFAGDWVMFADMLRGRIRF
jgi:hypothetical protein